MKQGIHPKYDKTVIKCACGSQFETRSTVFPEIHVELCSACHPFYTGKQKFVDTAGRVDKFRARLEAAQKVKPDVKPAKEVENNKRDPKEVLKDIKAEISKPIAVDQAMNSDEEIAAEEELAEAKESDKQ